MNYFDFPYYLIDTFGAETFNIVFKPGNNIVYAVATPLQSEDFIYYDIYTPERSFTIKPNKTDSDLLKWTDLHGNENEWYTLAGEAIENKKGTFEPT